jgi:KDO2-lipid IV(A) lauroyltransferase
MKTFIYYLQYLGVRAIAALLTALPRSLVYRLARGLALFVYYVPGIRRQVSMTNLQKALGRDRSPEELAGICRDSYIQIGMTMFEMLLTGKLKKTIDSMKEAPELRLLQENLRKNKGIIAITAHFGSWELAGTALTGTGRPVTVVGARQSNPFLDAYIKRSRNLLGMEVVENRTDALKPLIRALKKNNIIGLVSDQDAGRDGIFVNFFGHPASTPPGAAQLALRYNAPMLLVLARRTIPGRYRLIVREVPVTPDDTITTLTQRYTTMIEDVIRQYPEQYFWMHRRWKTAVARDQGSGVRDRRPGKT